jgi:uncharacterized protein YndB with AHSA1/START domain
MPISVCPATTVAAPVEYVWELLSDFKLYDLWWDARLRRVVPEGKTAPGQIAYARFSMTFKVIAVDPTKHRIQIDVGLPFGIKDLATITATPIDATSCHLSFG